MNETTIKNLTNNGFSVIRVKQGQDAKKKIFELIPPGSEVMTMTSITLESTGIAKELNESGQYVSIRGKFNSINAKEKKHLGSAPDWTVGSVHAITETGHIFVASNTGSQLPAYAYGANNVIWVVGSQKLVKDDTAALKRIYEYVLPLESDRANKAYQISTGSFVSKLLILNREVTPNRITIILVDEPLGF